MRSAEQGVAVAVPFGWLGMVLAISFLETPLRFRAPGITLPLGLGIGRLARRIRPVGRLAVGNLPVGRDALRRHATLSHASEPGSVYRSGRVSR